MLKNSIFPYFYPAWLSSCGLDLNYGEGFHRTILRASSATDAEFIVNYCYSVNDPECKFGSFRIKIIAFHQLCIHRADGITYPAPNTLFRLNYFFVFLICLCH